MDLVAPFGAQGQHALGIGQERAPRLGELEGVAAPAEELGAQLCLQRRDAPAESRLGKAKHHGRAGEAVGARHLDEGLELIEGHKGPRACYRKSQWLIWALTCGIIALTGLQ